MVQLGEDCRWWVVPPGTGDELLNGDGVPRPAADPRLRSHGTHTDLANGHVGRVATAVINRPVQLPDNRRTAPVAALRIVVVFLCAEPAHLAPDRGPATDPRPTHWRQAVGHMRCGAYSAPRPAGKRRDSDLPSCSPAHTLGVKIHAFRVPMRNDGWPPPSRRANTSPPGFPFLTQVIRGRYNEVDVSRKTPISRNGVAVSDVSMQLHGVKVAASDVLRGTVRQVRVHSGTEHGFHQTAGQTQSTYCTNYSWQAVLLRGLRCSSTAESVATRTPAAARGHRPRPDRVMPACVSQRWR